MALTRCLVASTVTQTKATVLLKNGQKGGMSKEPSSAMWGHCIAVYDEMTSQAETKEIYDEERLVYTGFLTKLFRKLGLTVPQYTYVMNELKRMDCVRQLRRGGGSSPSVWVLMHSPTPELFNKATNPLLNSRGNTRKNAVDILQSQINDLNARVDRLEGKGKQ